MKIDEILDNYPELDSTRKAELKEELLGLFNVIGCCFNHKLEIITELDNKAKHLLHYDKIKRREWTEFKHKIMKDFKLDIWNNQ